MNKLWFKCGVTFAALAAALILVSVFLIQSQHIYYSVAGWLAALFSVATLRIVLFPVAFVPLNGIAVAVLAVVVWFIVGSVIGFIIQKLKASQYA